jgi:hypothetical protein
MLRITRIEPNPSCILETPINWLLALCFSPDLCAIRVGMNPELANVPDRFGLGIRAADWWAQLDVSRLIRSGAYILADSYLVQAMVQIADYNRNNPKSKLILEDFESYPEPRWLNYFDIIQKTTGEYIGQVSYCDSGSQLPEISDKLQSCSYGTEQFMVGALNSCRQLCDLNQEIQ